MLSDVPLMCAGPWIGMVAEYQAKPSRASDFASSGVRKSI
jgi:hypothetical protein